MKKLLCLLLIVFTVFFTLNTVNAQNDVVRIHIRANSDSEYDQTVKLAVRDEINEYLAPILTACKTKEQAELAILNELENIETIGARIANSSVCAKLTTEHFPEKTYNDLTLPQGEYSALIIEIGEGKGRNWWCVAFPAMCYTTSSESKPVYKSFIVELLERIGIL